MLKKKNQTERKQQEQGLKQRVARNEMSIFQELRVWVFLWVEGGFFSSISSQLMPQ